MNLTKIYGARWQVYGSILIISPREGRPEDEKDQKKDQKVVRRQAEALLVSSRSKIIVIQLFITFPMWKTKVTFSVRLLWYHY